MSSNLNYRSTNDKGFTLAELMISVLILAIISTLAYRSLSAIIRSKQILDQERDVLMIANSVLSRVTKEFQRATNRKLLPPGGNTASAYKQDVYLIGEDKKMGSGDADSITFMADEVGQYVSDDQHNTSMVQIGYRVEKNPDLKETSGKKTTYLLIRDEVPDIKPYDKAFKRRMTFPVTDKLISLNLSYYDKDNSQWLNEWDQTKAAKLPAVIKVTIELENLAGQPRSFTTILPVSPLDVAKN